MNKDAAANETMEPLQVEGELERAEDFYARLRGRVAGWAERRGEAGQKVTPYLLLLPDLFALLIRLIRDPRVGAGAKLKMLAATAYVIAPLDLIPDFLLPFGLLDDTVAAALVLSQVVSLMDDAGEEVLEEHWEGTGPVLDAIKRVLGAADDLLSGRTLDRLRRRLGSEAG